MRAPDEFIQIKNAALLKGDYHIIDRRERGKGIEETMQAIGFHGADQSPEYEGLIQDIVDLLLELTTEHLVKLKPEYDYADVKNGTRVMDEKVGSFVAKGRVIWKFKLEVLDDVILYIKLKDESDRRGIVCISFHEDL